MTRPHSRLTRCLGAAKPEEMELWIHGDEGEEAGRTQAGVIAALGTPQVQAPGLMELEPDSVPDPP